MKVSILIPVYGVERYIEACVRSLMEQTYKDIEYIFVNDCTPDDSIRVLLETVNQYPDRSHQVRIVEHKENKGVGAVRQSALQAATGDVILFVDSDDYIADHAVELLVKKMLNDHVDIVDGGFAVVANGEITKRVTPPHMSTQSYLKRVLCQNLEPSRIWGRLISRPLFVDHHIIFQDGIDYSEDFSVLPLLLINGSRSWIDESIYFYRDDSPNSYTNNISAKSAVSFFRANQLIGSSLMSHHLWKEFKIATEIGWVNVQRFARRFNIEKSLLDQHFTLRPANPVLKALCCMMRSKHVPEGLPVFMYKAIRRVYLSMA